MSMGMSIKTETGIMRVELLLTLCLLFFFVAVAALGSYERNSCPVQPGDVVQNVVGHQIGTIQMIRTTPDEKTPSCHVAIIYTNDGLEYWVSASNLKKLSDTEALH